MNGKREKIKEKVRESAADAEKSELKQRDHGYSIRGNRKHQAHKHLIRRREKSMKARRVGGDGGLCSSCSRIFVFFSQLNRRVGKSKIDCKAWSGVEWEYRHNKCGRLPLR